MIEFPLPGEEERFKLLKLYLNKAAKDAQLNYKVIREAARKTEGFYGREMALLVDVVVVLVDSQSTLDVQLFEAIVDLKLEERKAKFSGQISLFLSLSLSKLTSHFLKGSLSSLSEKCLIHLHSFRGQLHGIAKSW